MELQWRHPVGDSARIESALLDAQVDLNPHHVDAALFCVCWPFSKGVILAAEVGRRKTNEAGLVFTQRWRSAVAASSLWCLRASARSGSKSGPRRLSAISDPRDEVVQRRNQGEGLQSFDPPGADPAVVECSYQFAARKAAELSMVQWDQAILDEAHRLRGFKPGAKTAVVVRTVL